MCAQKKEPKDVESANFNTTAAENVSKVIGTIIRLYVGKVIQKGLQLLCVPCALRKHPKNVATVSFSSTAANNARRTIGRIIKLFARKSRRRRSSKKHPSQPRGSALKFQAL